MTAYVIIIRNETRDPDEIKRYAELAPRAPIDKLEIIAAKTNRFKVLEGGPAEAVVILKFPTWDDALEWYDSDAYQEARAHRLRGADTRAALVEGVDAPSSSQSGAR